MQGRSFDDFDNSLLVKIFSDVHFKDLLHIRQVCKKWYSLFKDPTAKLSLLKVHDRDKYDEIFYLTQPIQQVLKSEDSPTNHSAFIKILLYINHRPVIAERQLIRDHFYKEKIKKIYNTKLTKTSLFFWTIACNQLAELKTLAEEEINPKQLRLATTIAAGAGYSDMVEYLATLIDFKSMQPDDETNQDLTLPLHLASYHGHEATVKVLLDHGVDANQHDGGHIPLYYASDQGHLSIVKMLIPKSNIINWHMTKETALFAAARKGYLEILKLLCEAFPKSVMNVDYATRIYPAEIAIRNKHKPVIEYFIESHIKEINNGIFNLTNSPHYIDNIPLVYFAIDNGDREMVNWLVGKGANLDTIRSHKSLCKRLFSDNAIRGNEDNIKYFIKELQLDINSIGCEGGTALHSIVENACLVACCHKFVKGSNFYRSNAEFLRTYLDNQFKKFTVLAPYLNACSLLLKYGADINRGFKHEVQHPVFHMTC